MRKLWTFLIEILASAIVIGWLLWKYPDYIGRIVPWLSLLILWHVTWLFLNWDPVKSQARVAFERFGRMGWILAFLFGGCVSLLYWHGIGLGLSALAKQHLAAPSSQTPAKPELPQPIPSPPQKTPEPVAHPKNLHQPKTVASSVISDAQMQAMISTLVQLGGEPIRIMCVGTQQQSQINCQKIQDVFKAAHWIVSGGDVGLQISAGSGNNLTSTLNIVMIAPLIDEDPAKTVKLAFENGKVHVSYQKQGWTGPSSLGPVPQVTIVVGPSVE
jgi:hypothetical protein